MQRRFKTLPDDFLDGVSPGDDVSARVCAASVLQKISSKQGV